MPPPKKVDKKTEKGQQKAFEKQKQKIAEDKTFGLKNKNKSKSVQKFIKSVQSAAKGQHNVSDQALKEQEHQQKEEKKKQLQQAALLASLFKGTENIKKISENDSRRIDPATIKAEQQIDLYTDQREQKKGETMADWDQAKLEEVIKTKHGASQAKPTDIVCKFFLDALERRQYGWFWQCPNGGDTCKYRHCLPPGYVLKRDVPKEEEDEEDGDPLEEIIERERQALPSGGTKVTLETFKAWKEKKEQDRLAALEAVAAKAESKKGGILSGRDLFTFNPTLFVDDAAAADEDDYQEDEEYWAEIINQNQQTLDAANAEAEEGGLPSKCESSGNDYSTSHNPSENDDENEENDDENDLAQEEAEQRAVAAATKIQITLGKESLFLEDDIPNLDDLDDE